MKPDQFEFAQTEPTGAKRKIRKGFLKAYRDGRQACRQGLPKIPPYKSANDWRRAFRHYWAEGYAHEAQHRPEEAYEAAD